MLFHKKEYCVYSHLSVFEFRYNCFDMVKTEDKDYGISESDFNIEEQPKANQKYLYIPQETN